MSSDEAIARPHTSGLVDWDEIWNAPTGADWLLEPLIARGRSHAIYGPAKSGKSLLALYAASALATGRGVLHHPGGMPCRVLYADAEMTADDVLERMESYGYTSDDDLSRLVYYLLPDLAPLDTPEGGMELVDLARWHEVDLVIVDTVARTTRGEENSADTARNLARFAMQPLKRHGITSVRLDHAGKDSSRGQRGTSAKNDDVDIVWELAPAEDGIRLNATHRRVGWCPQRLDLHIQEEPRLDYVPAATWPAGTKTCAEHLDDLGVPLDASRRSATAALRDAGHGTRIATVTAALRYRRDNVGNHPRNHLELLDGNH